MQELRLVAVSEDGTYLVLATAGRGTRFTLPVDDRLRAAVRGHFSRLGQFEIEVESPLRPKEIQARIRAGETAEEIAESAGIPVERVRWFEGPVLQEREYMAQQAQRVAVRRPGESSPGPPLGEMVEERLNRGGVDLEDIEWDSWKCEDSTWRVRLSFFDDGRPHAAEWIFDPRRRHLSALDEVAARLSSLDWDASMSGADDTVTPLLPRRAMKVVQDAPEEDEPRREYIVERGRMVAPAYDEPTHPAAVERPQSAPADEPEAYSGVIEPAEEELASPTEAAGSEPAAAGPITETAAAPEQTAAAAEAVEVPAATQPTQPAQAASADVGADTAEAAQLDQQADAPPAAAAPAQATQAAQATGSDEAPAATQQPAAPAQAADAGADTAGATKGAQQAAAVSAESARSDEPAVEETSQAAPAKRRAEVAETAKPRPPKQQRARKTPSRAPAPPMEEQVAEPAAAAAAGGDVPQRQPAGRNRRKSKGKRASVPSWDEIMFGARRPD